MPTSFKYFKICLSFVQKTVLNKHIIYFIFYPSHVKKQMHYVYLRKESFHLTRKIKQEVFFTKLSNMISRTQMFFKENLNRFKVHIKISKCNWMQKKVWKCCTVIVGKVHLFSHYKKVHISIKLQENYRNNCYLKFVVLYQLSLQLIRQNIFMIFITHKNKTNILNTCINVFLINSCLHEL